MAQYLVSIRYGMMQSIENFQSDVDGIIICDTVIIQTERGIEWGEVIKPPEEINRAIKGLGSVMRKATETDLGIIQHIKESKEPEEFDYCKRCIQERRLPMKLIGVEHLFSSDKVIFYFLADGRVDFRELVKDLARRYRTRIEMRQIGVRDEARLLADYEHCGQELCCRTFLRNLEPVTMRMAKMQKTTLDPNKISGHCGRLMCCLRFEDEVYTELRKELPKKGRMVSTSHFRGEVVSQNVLKQEVWLRLDDGRREWVHISEIQEIQNKAPGQGVVDRNDRRGAGGNPRGSERRDRGRIDDRAQKNPPAGGGPSSGEPTSHGDA